jgi:hypothetical protein
VDLGTDRLTAWLDADWRLGREELKRRRVLDRIADRIVADLRRKIGTPYRLDELVAFYERGSDWAVAIAVEVAPKDPWAWAPDPVVEAAYGRYARFARDVAGGRRIGGTTKNTEYSGWGA